MLKLEMYLQKMIGIRFSLVCALEIGAKTNTGLIVNYIKFVKNITFLTFISNFDSIVYHLLMNYIAFYCDHH